MSRVLVLGSTGVVGSRVAKELVARGHDVLGATRADGAHSVEGVKAVKLDLFDARSFADALDGVELVFALSPSGYADAYAALAPFLEQAANTASVERIILMTAQGVEYDDTIPLRRLELLLEDQDELETAFIRPNWFMQNFVNYWGGMLKEGTLRLPAADARVAFVDADDIAASAVALLETRDTSLLGQGWSITGPEALTHAEAVEQIAAATGRPIVYEAISDEEALERFQGLGLPLDYAQLLTGLFGVVRQGAAAMSTQDVETLTSQEPGTLERYVAAHAHLL